MVKKISLKNLGSKTEKITYCLPAKKFFVPEYPRVITLSSGMSCSINVRFRPTELIHYVDFLQFECRSGKFQIQMEACLPKHHLNTISDINFGECPTDFDNKRKFTLENTGDCVTRFKWQFAEPFIVEPASGELDVGKSVEVSVVFKSKSAVNVMGNIVCEYGDGTRLTVAVAARAHFPLLRSSLYNIDFGSNCYTRGVKTITFDLVNDGLVKAHFQIKQISEHPHSAFSISKMKGTVASHASASLSVRFSPSVRDMQYLSVFRVLCAGGHAFDIECRGDSKGPIIEIKPSLLNFGHTQTGEETSKSIIFKNNSNVDTFVQVRSPANDVFDFHCNTPINVAPQCTVSVPVIFKSTVSGHFYQEIEIWTQESVSTVVNLIGTCSSNFKEIPEGRHEVLVQEFKNGAPIYNETATACPIMVEQVFSQMCSNSCKSIKISNNSQITQRIGVRFYPHTESLSAFIPREIISPGEMTKVNIECSAPYSISKHIYLSIVAYPAKFDPDRPYFMKLNIVPIEILIGMPKVTDVTIPEAYSKMTLKPVLNGQASSLTFPILNNSDESTVIEWSQQSNMTILPSRSLFPAKSSKLCTVYVKSNSMGVVKIPMKAKLIAAGDSSQEMTFGETKLDTMEPSVHLIDPVDGKRIFSPIFIGTTSTSVISYYNDSPTRAAFKVAIENGENLMVQPTSGYLEPFSLTDIGVVYQSDNPGRLKAVIHLDFQFASEAHRRISVEIRGKCVSPDFECIPKQIDLGHKLLHSSFTYPITLRNNSEASVPCIITVLNEKDPSMVVQKESLKLMAQTSSRFFVKLVVPNVMENTFSVIFSPVNESGAELHEFKKKVCTIHITGAKAVCVIEDMWAVGKSKGELWKNFSVSRFNQIINGEIIHHLNREDTFPTAYINFGRCQYESNASVVTKLKIRNNSVVPAEWMIYSVLDGSASGDHANSLISFSPESARLLPNESCTVTVTFAPKSFGYKNTSMIFELGQGYDEQTTRCQLVLLAMVTPQTISRAVSEVEDEPVPVSAFPFYSNCSIVPKQKITCPRPAFVPVAGDFKAILSSNSKLMPIDDVQISSNGDTIEFPIAARLSLLESGEAWTEVVTLQNDVAKFPVELLLSEKKLTNEMIKEGGYNIQEFALSKITSQSLQISKDCLDFGVVPVDTFQRSVLVVKNLSKTQTYLLSWSIPPAHDNMEISLKPNQGVKLAPQASCSFEIMVKLGKHPEIHTAELQLFADDGALANQSSLASINSVQTSPKRGKIKTIDIGPKQLNVSIQATAIHLSDYHTFGGESLRQTVASVISEDFSQAISSKIDENDRDFIEAIKLVTEKIIAQIIQTEKYGILEATPPIKIWSGSQLAGEYRSSKDIQKIGKAPITISTVEKIILQQTLDSILADMIINYQEKSST